MLLFVGKKEKGFFSEETKEKVEYIDEALHIKDQAEAILRSKTRVALTAYRLRLAPCFRCITCDLRKSATKSCF